METEFQASGEVVNAHIFFAINGIFRVVAVNKLGAKEALIEYLTHPVTTGTDQERELTKKPRSDILFGNHDLHIDYAPVNITDEYTPDHPLRQITELDEHPDSTIKFIENFPIQKTGSFLRLGTD